MKECVLEYWLFKVYATRDFNGASNYFKMAPGHFPFAGLWGSIRQQSRIK